MKTILLITSEKERYYFEPFLDAATKVDGLRILIFDPALFPSKLQLAVYITPDGKVLGHIDAQSYEVDKEPSIVRVRIEEVNIGWFLRPRQPIPSQVSSEIEAKFATSESCAALDALYAVVPWRWINSKRVIRFIENNKAYQQLIAVQSGLAIPKTLVSNDPLSVQTYARQENGLLLKTFSYTDIGTKEGVFFYSNIFSEEEIANAPKAIQECPIFAQEYIQKKCEYRVMVIGNRILACRIDSQSSDKTKIDWRHYDFEKVAHDACELPKNVQSALLRFMSHIELKYAAIDIIETPAGEFIFLEANPSGQWGWIAHYAGLPIPEAVVEMLIAV